VIKAEAEIIAGSTGLLISLMQTMLRMCVSMHWLLFCHGKHMIVRDMLTKGGHCSITMLGPADCVTSLLIFLLFLVLLALPTNVLSLSSVRCTRHAGCVLWRALMAVVLTKMCLHLTIPHECSLPVPGQLLPRPQRPQPATPSM
jgi:hypothetical protein